VSNALGRYSQHSRVDRPTKVRRVDKTRTQGDRQDLSLGGSHATPFLTRLLIAGAFLFALLLPIAAQAQQVPCVQRDDALKRLDGKWGEVPVFRALTTGGKMLEILANLDTGTFTILETSPNGVACYAGAGEAARLVDEVGEEGPEA